MTEHPQKSITEAFAHKGSDYLPKGELWLDKMLFQYLKLEDNLHGHIELRKRLGMDILCLPLSASGISGQNMGYKRFDPDEIKTASELTDLFIVLIVDGPFQRLVDKHGIMMLLKDLGRINKYLVRMFKEESESVRHILENCLNNFGMKTGALLIADDIAYGQSTYINPDYLNDILGDFYRDATSTIHKAGLYALFHSCGNITGFIPYVISNGFDGIAACQSECVDLVRLKEAHGSNLVIFSGIDADILSSPELTPLQKKKFCEQMTLLSRNGGFILCSSCGIYTQESLNRLQELYHMTDAMHKSECINN